MDVFLVGLLTIVALPLQGDRPPPAAIEELPIADAPQLQPSYPSFGSDRLDQQLRLYEQYLRTDGRPDVLIVGSSRSLQGIDPGALEQALLSQGYPALKIYNFSINGATARVVDLLLRQILAADQLPRLLIWGDGLRAFNSGRPDLTYGSIVASEGYRTLRSGRRPIRLASEDTIECRPARPTVLPSCLGQPDLYLPSSDVSDLQRNGFLSIATRFDPASYYRSRPRVSGRYDSSYVPFDLAGEQLAATVSVARFARDRQIPLVFVSLPLTHDYLDMARQSYERRFRQQMQAVADREGFAFRDYSLRWLTQASNFADPSHLNQTGAIAVARELASDAVIPWPSEP